MDIGNSYVADRNIAGVGDSETVGNDIAGIDRTRCVGSLDDRKLWIQDKNHGGGAKGRRGLARDGASRAGRVVNITVAAAVAVKISLRDSIVESASFAGTSGKCCDSRVAADRAYWRSKRIAYRDPCDG